jgi:hypothetical protein
MNGGIRVVSLSRDTTIRRSGREHIFVARILALLAKIRRPPKNRNSGYHILVRHLQANVWTIRTRWWSLSKGCLAPQDPNQPVEITVFHGIVLSKLATRRVTATRSTRRQRACLTRCIADQIGSEGRD